MLNINRALGKDRRLRGLTGLNRKAFDDLLPTFTSELEKARLMPPEQPCQRAFGGGRKGKLDSPAEKLFFILFYLKCYPIFEVAGVLFDCDASQACRWVHTWPPILEAALDQKFALPARKLESLEDFLRRCPDVKRIMMDGTERPNDFVAQASLVRKIPRNKNSITLARSGDIPANTWRQWIKINGYLF